MLGICLERARVCVSAVLQAIRIRFLIILFIFFGWFVKFFFYFFI